MRFFPEKEILVSTVRIGKRKALVLKNRNMHSVSAGVLWIHGGGYATGMKEMVYSSRAYDLVKECGITVVSVDYRLSAFHPYPAGFDDCYAALLWMKENALKLNIRSDQIMVGGESAGGGMTAALCMKARDEHSVNIAFQMPLYPMLDHRDTETSRDNHGRIWNTRNNHQAWAMYLRKCKNEIPYYASPALCSDCSGLPPAYTFVCEGEPFLQETKDYIRHLKEAGIEAEMDVYPGNMHAFDMIRPRMKTSIQAAEAFRQHFRKALTNYYAPQEEKVI